MQLIEQLLTGWRDRRRQAARRSDDVLCAHKHYDWSKVTD